MHATTPSRRNKAVARGNLIGNTLSHFHLPLMMVGRGFDLRRLKCRRERELCFGDGCVVMTSATGLTCIETSILTSGLKKSDCKVCETLRDLLLDLIVLCRRQFSLWVRRRWIACPSVSQMIVVSSVLLLLAS